MKKVDVVHAILGERIHHAPPFLTASTFAPTNIALCKYWGKRDSELNLPETSSLSISLPEKGTATVIRVIDETFNREQIKNIACFTEYSEEDFLKIRNSSSDMIIFNEKYIHSASPFSQRLHLFLDLFRLKSSLRFYIEFTSNIPLAAGLASSASGFASVVLALNQLYDWRLSRRELSILARLGSGSACRSLWDGFVEWNMGSNADGMDSHGCPLSANWPELCMGLLLVNTSEKSISSREAMQRTKTTSSLYSLWPKKVCDDLTLIKEAIHAQDFSLLGKTAESNALAMHGIMLSAWPPISYCKPETIAAMQKIWKLREEGLELYFTQDAGPNLKLLFLKKNAERVKAQFPDVEILQFF